MSKIKFDWDKIKRYNSLDCLLNVVYPYKFFVKDYGIIPQKNIKSFLDALEHEISFINIERDFINWILENTSFWPIATEQLLFLMHSDLIETYEWISDKLIQWYREAVETWNNIDTIVRLDLDVVYTLDKIKCVKNDNLICNWFDEWHLFFKPENIVSTKEKKEIEKEIQYDEQRIELPESKTKWLLFSCLSSLSTLYLCKWWLTNRLCASIIDKDHIWYVQSQGISIINIDTIFVWVMQKLYDDNKISKRVFDEFREILKNKIDKSMKYTNFMNDVYQMQYLWEDCKNVEFYGKLSNGEPDYLEITAHTKSKDYSKWKDKIWLHWEINTKYADWKIVWLEVKKKYKYWKRKTK